MKKQKYLTKKLYSSTVNKLKQEVVMSEDKLPKHKKLLEDLRILEQAHTEDDVSCLVELLDAHVKDGHNVSIKCLESALKVYTGRKHQILTQDLLEYMQENDHTTLETSNYKVRIETFVSSKTTNKAKALEWLRERKYHDLIQEVFEFKKSEVTEERFAKLTETLKDLGLAFTCDSKVNGQSLKSALKTRLSLGEDVPSEEDGISLSYFQQCKVTEIAEK